MNYNCDIVEFEKIIMVEDLLVNKKWFCIIEKSFSKDMYEQIIQNPTSAPQKGKIWVHTPLGGALIGKKVGEKVCFYENGNKKYIKVCKIFS